MQPGKLNPYVPGSDLTGLLIGPMALLVLARGRKGKKGSSKADLLFLALIVILGGSITVAGCNSQGETPTPIPTKPPPDVRVTHNAIQQPGNTPTGALSPTLPLTPGATICPSQTPRPPTEWETTHGQAIANAAHELLNNADRYYIWGADSHPNDEDDGWPPPRERGGTWGFNDSIDIKERTGDRTPIVCADIADLSYKNGGFDLETSFPVWYEDFDNPPTRHVGALQNLVNEKGKLHQWGDGTPPELGDMIFFSDSSHMGIVAEIQCDGTDPTMVFVIQASYSLGVINKMPLNKWQTGHDPASFGHPEPNQ